MTPHWPPRVERKHWHVVSAADVRLRWALTGPKLPLSPPDKARTGWQRLEDCFILKVPWSDFFFSQLNLLNQMTWHWAKRSAGRLCWGLLWPKSGPSQDVSSLGLKWLLSHLAGSGVRSETVPELEPVGCVSTIKELAFEQKTWSWSRRKKNFCQRLVDNQAWSWTRLRRNEFMF